MKIVHQFKDHVLIYINESLKNLCRANGFCFVNNDNISEGNLYKRRLHLHKAGKRILAYLNVSYNFINGINNYYFLLKQRQNNHF